MPAEEELSPEEKLLKVIQDVPDEQTADVEKATAVEKGDDQKTTDVEKDDVQETHVEDGGDDVVAAELAPATVHAPATVAKSKLAPGTTIRTVNRVIGAALALLIVGLVWEIFAARPDMPETPTGGESAMRPTIVPLGPVGEYVAAATNRDLFIPYGTEVIIEQGRPKAPRDESFEKVANYVAKNVKLSALSRSEDSADSFAIIVDERRGAMHYPGVGDELPVEIAEGVEVTLALTKIREGSVVLIYKGQKGERSIILKGKR